MKCRIPTINDMVDNEVKKELRRTRNEIYDEVVEDVVKQTIGWMLYYLDKQCGYRTKRLTDVVNGMNETIMEATRNGLTPNDILRYLKAEYGIDLSCTDVKTLDEFKGE